MWLRLVLVLVLVLRLSLRGTLAASRPLLTAATAS